METELDIIKIRTVEDLNSIDFSKYASKLHKSWVKHIQYPVDSKELSRVCNLSDEKNAKTGLCWRGGELFYHKKVVNKVE